ncbi:DUF1896 family protein [Flavobacterium hibernum]|uniref:DUF1896 domain-containing protein n=1 Tax=Flavobacterium hibernum TaxID=37752 RepID=A0A0D0EN61_9FLAO|nr:DUF1896 family protein [Flavobacterium hibernum]KIO54345.1 hypothetical protein IW18_02500 [Flavobacterium hibernum]OXA88190.1 hypothetical protein B0A73_10495 [Flavobacterium hibernum]STO10815.1 Uncharacterised protein [Flavobacterium hibernum]
MEDLLKEKLWFYIIHNNPDLMFTLQEDYSVLDYLNEKISSVKSILDDMLSDGTPKYIIEEICLNVLTEDLKPSRFLYIRSLLSEEFEKTYAAFQESGILTYEVMNLMENCRPVFETIGFTKENEEDPNLRNALIGLIADYLN